MAMVCVCTRAVVAEAVVVVKYSFHFHHLPCTLMIDDGKDNDGNKTLHFVQSRVSRLSHMKPSYSVCLCLD